MEMCVQAYEVGRIGKSVLLILSRDGGEGKISTEAAELLLARKAASECKSARTANQHR